MQIVHQNSLRESHQNRSIQTKQVVEFPLSPRSAKEKPALLRKRFDELIVEKLAIEKQAKLQSNRIHKEYKQTMRDMEKLEMAAEKPEEDLLEDLGAVLENNKSRKDMENWVEAVVSIHSARLVQTAEQQEPLIISATPTQTRPNLYLPPQFKPS